MLASIVSLFCGFLFACNFKFRAQFLFCSESEDNSNCRVANLLNFVLNFDAAQKQVKFAHLNQPSDWTILFVFTRTWMWTPEKKIGQLKLKHGLDKNLIDVEFVSWHTKQKNYNNNNSSSGRSSNEIERLIVANHISQHKTRWFNRN